MRQLSRRDLTLLYVNTIDIKMGKYTLRLAFDNRRAPAQFNVHELNDKYHIK
jgi:hypothetical protein